MTSPWPHRGDDEGGEVGRGLVGHLGQRGDTPAGEAEQLAHHRAVQAVVARQGGGHRADPGAPLVDDHGGRGVGGRGLQGGVGRAGVGRAEAIVRDVAPDVTVERVPFVMEVGSQARDAALSDAAAVLVAHLDAGERVAFVTLGDPSVYSTFSSLAGSVRRLRPAVPVDVVPGIMAFQDLAARTGTTVVDGTEHLVLVPAHAGAGNAALEAAAADPSAAVVVYKGGARIGAVAATLAGHDRLDGAVMGELLGLPGGRVAPLAEVADRPASYLATLIVPPVRPQ